MAYIRNIEETCHCGKRATVEVVNFRNCPMGRYCKTHGSKRLKEVQGYEDAELKRYEG